MLNNQRMENDVIVLSDFTRDMFDVPQRVHEEMLIPWLEKQVEIIKDKLIKRGYDEVGNHGFGIVHFKKGNYTYAIWPEDQEYCQYGILKIDGLRYSHDDLSRIYHLYGSHDQLDEFLALVDKNEWSWIELLSNDLKELYEKYGDDTHEERWTTINNLFHKNL